MMSLYTRGMLVPVRRADILRQPETETAQFSMPDNASNRRRRPLFPVTLGLMIVFAAGVSRAGDGLIAVAANFGETARTLETRFEETTDHSVTLVIGSTGKLYAQIVNGAPFDAFLAADQRRPALLADEGRAVAGSRFTYAVGRLSLWSPDPRRIPLDGVETLAAGKFRRLAMANPRLAPYGAAAAEVLRSLGLLDAMAERIVMGENVGQVYSMVATGNAELGFVALSQALTMAPADAGSRWDVPTELHSQIRQDAVLLDHGRSNVAAREFLRFLTGAEGAGIIRSFGYDMD
jgi:molybdate transport system substrate-binding protein